MPKVGVGVGCGVSVAVGSLLVAAAPAVFVATVGMLLLSVGRLGDGGSKQQDAPILAAAAG